MQRLYQRRCCVQTRRAKTQGLQVFVAGFDPVREGEQGADRVGVGFHVTGHLGAQVHVHADGPTGGARLLHHGLYFVDFGRDKQQRTGVEHAGAVGQCVRCQALQHGVRRVVAVGNAFAVKAVAGLAILDLHHGQRSGAGAALRADLHAVGL